MNITTDMLSHHIANQFISMILRIISVRQCFHMYLIWWVLLQFGSNVELKWQCTCDDLGMRGVMTCVFATNGGSLWHQPMSLCRYTSSFITIPHLLRLLLYPTQCLWQHTHAHTRSALEINPLDLSTLITLITFSLMINALLVHWVYWPNVLFLLT